MICCLIRFFWFLGYPWYPQGFSSTPTFKSLNTVNVYLEVNINGSKMFLKRKESSLMPTHSLGNLDVFIDMGLFAGEGRGRQVTKHMSHSSTHNYLP